MLCGSSSHAQGPARWPVPAALCPTAPTPPAADRYYLRRFLRARQHDLKRAQAMFLVRACSASRLPPHQCCCWMWGALGPSRVAWREPGAHNAYWRCSAVWLFPAPVLNVLLWHMAAMQAHLKWREDNGIDTILTDFHFEASGSALHCHAWLPPRAAAALKQAARLTPCHLNACHPCQTGAGCLPGALPPGLPQV